MSLCNVNNGNNFEIAAITYCSAFTSKFTENKFISLVN